MLFPPGSPSAPGAAACPGSLRGKSSSWGVGPCSPAEGQGGLLVLSHLTCTKNHSIRANRAAKMFRRSSSAFPSQSNHCTLITSDAHLLNLCQKSSSDGDLTASLDIAIVIKFIPVFDLSPLQFLSITLCPREIETNSFPSSLQQHFALSQALLLPPRSGHQLFMMQGAWA